MRNPLLTLVVSGIAFGLVTFQPGIVNAQEMTTIKAGDAAPICVALNKYNPPMQSARIKFRMNPDQVAFCGQCTTNSDCGTCRCVGPSDGSCNECSCP
jgi:hypothetical protein